MMNNYIDTLISDVGASLVGNILAGEPNTLIADMRKCVTTTTLSTPDEVHQLSRLVEANRQLFFMEVAYENIMFSPEIMSANRLALLTNIESALVELDSSSYELSYAAFNVIMACCVRLREVVNV